MNLTTIFISGACRVIISFSFMFTFFGDSIVINKSGWWLLISFTIIGVIPLIIWMATEGTKKNNLYGKPIKLKR